MALPDAARTRRRSPLSPYGVTKLAAEHLCVLYDEEHGVNTIALRYFSVYGPRQRPDMAFRRFSEAVLAGRPIELFGDGRQTRDFTYVADIVAATRAAGEGAGDGRVQRRRRRAHQRQPGAGDPGRRGRATARRAPRRARVGRRPATPAPTSHAPASQLGYEPSTSVEEGLAAEFEWVRDCGARPRAMAALSG